MCGIAGIVFVEGGAAEAGIAAALECLRHRGPDGPPGIWNDNHCVLGQSRLAIIDLTELGRAPMPNEDSTVWVTHNGEIYNFRQLRTELEAVGHRFRGQGDTEVIVHAYEEWGTDCVTRFRGMFAFAVWDAKSRRLFVARDRLGKKPFFYSERDGRLQFASEIHALFAFPEPPDPEPDLQAIDAYLSLGYVPAPRSGFESIKKLPPAHTLVFDVDRPSCVVEQYWSLDYVPKLDITEEEAGARLRELLTEAVRLRLISDVPLGAFLSGGIDSSIVVGLMAQLSSDPVRTFSIGFDVASYNEIDHARRIAEKWGTDHHEHHVEPDAIDLLPLLVRHYGEPYADSSALPTFYVSRAARAEVTVALNGDGGDESFAGYDRYRGNRVAGHVDRVPGARSATRWLGSVLPDSTDPKGRVRRARRFLKVAGHPAAQRYGHWMSYFTDDDKDRLYAPEFASAVADRWGMSWFGSLFAGTEGLDPVDQAMSVDVNSYLPYDLLVKVDITAMANSLETRSPFLDHEVMEFAAALPASMKLRGSTAKYLLKKEFSDLLPPQNVNRPKMGFGVPVGHWFRGPLRDLLREHLLSGTTLERGYFQRAPVEKLVNEHLSSSADHSNKLWNLLMLEMWHREMIDPSSSRSETALSST